MDNETSLALVSKFETLDFETGELVNVLESALPVKSRIDPAKWLIDRFNSEIELCKNRKVLWNEREQIFKEGVETIRSRIKRDMIEEGVDKIKTIENTVYITRKQSLIANDEESVPKELKLYELTVKNLDYEHLQEFLALCMEYDITYTYKDRIEPILLPNDMKQKITTSTLTIRKSAKAE